MHGGRSPAEGEIGIFKIDDGFGQGILPYMFLGTTGMPAI
jgi:hypothetical protein